LKYVINRTLTEYF